MPLRSLPAMSLVVAVFGATACADGLASPLVARVRVTTDSLEYTRDATTGRPGIGLRIRNAGLWPVRMSSACGEPVSLALDRREGQAWALWSGFPCPAVYALTDTVLAPGDEYVTTGAFAGDAPGTYRYRVWYEVERGGRQGRVTASNAFLVH